jgi:hypothetical protein
MVKEITEALSGAVPMMVRPGTFSSFAVAMASKRCSCAWMFSMSSDSM